MGVVAGASARSRNGSLMAVKTQEQSNLSGSGDAMLLLDAIPVPVFLCTATGILTGANSVFLSRFGKPDDGALPEVRQAMQGLAPLLDGAGFVGGWTTAVRGLRLEAISRDGQPYGVTLSPLPASGQTGIPGNASGMPQLIGVLTDHSAMAQCRQTLLRVEQQLDEAYRSAKLGGWEYDITTGALTLQGEAWSVLGHEQGAFPASLQGLLGVMAVDDRQRFTTMLEGAVRNPRRLYLEFRVNDEVGRNHKITCSCTPRYNEAGQAIQLYGVMIDITEKSEVASELEAAKLRLEEAYRTGHLGYWEYGIKSGCLSWSREAYEIHGQSPLTFDPSFDALLEILHPDDRLQYGAMLESVIGNPKRVYVEYRVIDDEHETRWISTSCAPRFDQEGRLSHVFGVMLDTSERARVAAAQRQTAEQIEMAADELCEAQDGLLQNEQLASVGRLAVGIGRTLYEPAASALSRAAHLLASAQAQMHQLDPEGNQQDARRWLNETAAIAPILKEGYGKLSALSRMVSQMATAEAEDPACDFDLRQSIDDLLMTLQDQITQSGHQLRLSCPSQLMIRTRQGALVRVITHLVRNALAHAFLPDQQGQIDLVVEALEDDWVELRVSDNGQGILEAEHKRIFDPFITTARHEGCVGLGLHVARTLVSNRLGGSLSMESRIGEGCRFFLRIPRKLEE